MQLCTFARGGSRIGATACTMCRVFDARGQQVGIRLQVRGLVFGAVATAAIAAPIGVLTGEPSSQTIADCGGINIPIITEGTPVDTCPAPVAPPMISGGAPSQELLTACSGIPGCLSNALYGPGNVLVPSPNTRVQQSQ